MKFFAVVLLAVAAFSTCNADTYEAEASNGDKCVCVAQTVVEEIPAIPQECAPYVDTGSYAKGAAARKQFWGHHKAAQKGAAARKQLGWHHKAAQKGAAARKQYWGKKGAAKKGAAQKGFRGRYVSGF